MSLFNEGVRITDIRFDLLFGFFPGFQNQNTLSCINVSWKSA